MCIDIDRPSLVEASAPTGTSRAIAATLAKFGPGAVAFAARAGVRIAPLALGQRYRDASRSLRRLGVDVDAWPVAPAGLFVVEERTVYLRSTTPMTVAHEFAHALDCALGGGVYRSGYDPEIRHAFSRASAFVTPYAASGIDEYFAESMRAYVGVNDPTSPWAAVSRAKLRAGDALIHDVLVRIFDEEFADFSALSAAL